MNKWTMRVASAVLAASLPLVAQAADDALTQQVNTAQAHASMAAAADSLDLTQTPPAPCHKLPRGPRWRWL